MAETKLELVVTAQKALPAIQSVKGQLTGLDKTATQVQSTVSGKGGMFAGMKKSLGGLPGLINPVTAGLAGIAALGGGLAVVKSQINMADEMAKTARAVNMSVEEFSALNFAAGQLGMSTNELANGIDKTERRLAMFAETGKGPAKQALEALGISQTQLQEGLANSANGLEFIMPKLAAIEDPAMRAHAAFILGGKGLQELVAQTGGSLEPLENLKTRASEVGAVMSTEFAEGSERVNDMLDDMGKMMNGVFMQLAEKLLPHFEKFLQGVLENAPAIIDGVTAAFQKMEPIFDVIGTILENVVIPVMGLLFDGLVKGAEMIKPVVDATLPALRSAIEGISEAFTDLPGLITDTFNILKNKLDGFLNTIAEWGRKAYDFITSPFRDAEEDVVGNSIVPDMVNKILAEFDRMASGMAQTSAQGANATVSNINTARTANENRVNSAIMLEDRHQDAIFATGNAITSTTSQIQSATSQVGGFVDSLLGKLESKGGLLGRVAGFAKSSGIGRSISTAFSGARSLFSGFFADGGRIPSGKFGVVGERGPEMVGGPATVTPMGAGGNITFNFNVSGGGGGGSGYMSQQDLNRLAAGLIQEARGMMIKQQGFGGALGVR